MKKLLFSILAAVSLMPTALNAQEYEYVPFVRESVEWGYEEHSVTGYIHYFHYRIEGDTLINGIPYKKCYRYNSCDEKEPILKGWIREQGKKVYMLANLKEWDDEEYFMMDEKEMKDEIMLYDFSVEKVGETIPAFEAPNFTVNRIDTVLIGDKLRKRYFYNGSAHIIEGVGTLSDCNLLRPFKPTPASITGRFTSLMYVKSETGQYEYVYTYFNDYCAECEAAEGYPLITSAKMWKFETIDIVSGKITGSFTLFSSNKWDVEGQDCQQFGTLWNGWGNPVYAYEEDGKAYYLNGANEWELVYDITLSKGDPIGAGYVVEEGTIEVDGTPRKWIEIDPGNGDESDRYIVVEGIGANKLPFYGLGSLDVVDGREYCRMLECHENGVCVFTADDFESLSSGIEEVSVDALPEADSKVYDLSGKEVVNPRKGSIYIKNRVKFIQE